MSADCFQNRHIGPDEQEIKEMLQVTGVKSLDELIDNTIPESIRLQSPLKIGNPMSEYEYLNRIREIGKKNRLFRSFIGMGYYNTISLQVIKRNILENPSWYTSYTPYQAEISQGRLEALLNFQTMVMSLTGMELANASLLDEATAASEAMIMMYNLRSREAVKEGVNKLFIDKNIFPQNISVIKTRALPLHIDVITGDYREFSHGKDFFGAILQYPGDDGSVQDYSGFVRNAKNSGILTAVIADLMSLVLLVPPGEWGADIAVGSTQRFGIPLGYGGPHAAYFASRESYKRSIPGRIIGVSVDRYNNPALRMALQTREQHIKREKATSNICTAQALLATMAGMYGIYHGPKGLKRIASGIHQHSVYLGNELKNLGYALREEVFFDSLKIIIPDKESQRKIQEEMIQKSINLRYFENGDIGISCDETINKDEINRILSVFAGIAGRSFNESGQISDKTVIPDKLRRKSPILQEGIFNKYRSETDLMRYIKSLERKDISLTHSMISLGSCTMKLNAASELMAFLWPEFADIHPFVPRDQADGYHILFEELKEDLKEVTGFADISFQPNSGAAGEYAGLMVIREYLLNKGEKERDVVLIPASAHGTNPASAVMAGMKVIVVPCDLKGNTDINALETLARENKDRLAALMITYPSTHGVFESEVRRMCEIIHLYGGQVYMDGANMNAQVGLTNPANIGADVCHLNLHKTFAIPHGGGGPGVGPIGVAPHLKEFIPRHPVVPTGGASGIDAIAGAPYGSASILTISHAYIKMLGGEGLTMATRIAILNANYMAAILNNYFPVLYKGENGKVGHEMILDCRGLKQSSGITESDIAKRLMDYGFHAPTLSFPVHGTLMVEPTESESKAELDRFIDAMKSIYLEIEEIRNGQADQQDNVLKNAPHTVMECTSSSWSHSYNREKACFPLGWIINNKFWPAVGRVDDAFGDRNLVCSCQPIENYK